MSLLLALGLSLMAGMGPAWDFASLAFFLRHQALNVFGLGSLNLLVGGGHKKDARVAQADGAVSVVGYDKPHRHHTMER